MAEETIIIELPQEAIGRPWLENGNRWLVFSVSGPSADFDSRVLPAGQWKIVSIEDKKVKLTKL